LGIVSIAEFIFFAVLIGGTKVFIAFSAPILVAAPGGRRQKITEACRARLTDVSVTEFGHFTVLVSYAINKLGNHF